MNETNWVPIGLAILVNCVSTAAIVATALANLKARLNSLEQKVEHLDTSDHSNLSGNASFGARLAAVERQVEALNVVKDTVIRIETTMTLRDKQIGDALEKGERQFAYIQTQLGQLTRELQKKGALFDDGR